MIGNWPELRLFIKVKAIKNNISNYRPISVVCHIAKLLEKEVQSQFLSYLQTNHLISVDQYAFLPNHSTNTCLHRVIDDWYESFNEKEKVGACFLDISKCFDCIDHELLLSKLNKYGILNTELKWFSSFLSGRKQAVYCHGKLSESKDITIGIPQGSILGPSLFLVFINDITDCLRLSTCNIYADDVVLYVSDMDINVITSKLQADLYAINEWYCKNRLHINTNKSNIMLLSSNTRCNDELSLKVHIDTETIEQVRSIRYLGIEIDDRLSWDIHIKSLTKSLSYKIFTLRKLSKFLSSSISNKIYKCSIQPILDYSCSVWGNCSLQNRNILLRLQKRAARIVVGNFDYNVNSLSIINSLKWQSIDTRRDCFLSCIMYNCIHGKAPVRLCNEVEMVFDRHGFNTRLANTLNVVLPKPNLECFKNCFRYAGGKIWNSLPSAFQNAKSVDVFKRMYKDKFFKPV